jgi:hypothetical protein
MKYKAFASLLVLSLAAGACQRNGESQPNSTNSAVASTSAAENSSRSGAGAGPANGSDANQSAQATNGLELRLVEDGFATGHPGLHSSGSIEFGQPKDQVIAAVAAIRGRPTAGRNAECPSGAVDYASFGPLDLHFQDGKFAGWVLDGAANPPIENEWGVAIGKRRSEIGDGDRDPPRFEQTSLGPEFSVEGIGGMLDGNTPNARVTTLFSGVSCFAR